MDSSLKTLSIDIIHYITSRMDNLVLSQRREIRSRKEHCEENRKQYNKLTREIKKKALKHVNKLMPCAWLHKGALEVWRLRLRVTVTSTMALSNTQGLPLAHQNEATIRSIYGRSAGR